MARKQRSEQPKWSESARVPGGFTLRQVLRSEGSRIFRIAWSPDGSGIVSGSADRQVSIWDTKRNRSKRVLGSHDSLVASVAWSPDGRLIASGDDHGAIRIWHIAAGSYDELTGHRNRVECLAWSPDGQLLASASADSSIRLWSRADDFISVLPLWGHSEWVNGVAWSPDGACLVSGAEDNTVRIWDARNGALQSTLKAYSHWVSDVAWSPDGELIAAAGRDASIRLWNPKTGQEIRVLEGHTEAVRCLCFSHDGGLLASRSHDDTVRIWRRDTWETVVILPEPTIADVNPVAGIAFHPREPRLATLGENDTIIRVWDLDVRSLLRQPALVPSIHFATAKIVLVGDSGVGKTGLGWRLTHGEFKEHASTHGEQFWLLDTLKHHRTDSTECEAVLWDLAGQPDYRLIHGLFLDDADLALVLFDAANRDEPLRGVDYWLKALAHRRGEPCRTVLVGARADRGWSALTEAELDTFCRDRKITGGFVITSGAMAPASTS